MLIRSDEGRFDAKFDARLFLNLSHSCHRRRFAVENTARWNLCSGLRVILMVEDKKLAVSLDVDHNPLPQLHTAILGRGRAWIRVGQRSRMSPEGRNAESRGGSGLFDPADLAKPQVESLTSMGIRRLDPVAGSIRDGHERDVSCAGHIAHPSHTCSGRRWPRRNENASECSDGCANASHRASSQVRNIIKCAARYSTQPGGTRPRLGQCSGMTPERDCG